LLELETKVDYLDLERCDGHYYQFDSAVDMRRHFDLCHAGVPTDSFCKDYFCCSRVKNGKACEFKCDSRAELDLHVESIHQRSAKRTIKQSIQEDDPVLLRKDGGDDGPARTLKKQKLENGSRVSVWFESRRKYFRGIIKRILNLEKSKCEMEWDDGRAKKNEIVILDPEHNTLDSSDSDRWNFL
jgi:hypothetical protein